MSEEALIDLWSRMKPFISKGDMLNAADMFVSSLDEHGLIDVNEHVVLSIGDPVLKDALVSYYDLEFDEDDEDGYE
tara:strand:+ start:1146 stop:1373 length:228 start_codon:yes stop_codon:yes gene_type:complete